MMIDDCLIMFDDDNNNDIGDKYEKKHNLKVNINVNVKSDESKSGRSGINKFNKRSK